VLRFLAAAAPAPAERLTAAAAAAPVSAWTSI